MMNVLVLDKDEYKKNHTRYLSMMDEMLEGKNHIIYTSYEDERIRRVRNYRYIGSILQHLLYWKKSYNYAKKIHKENVDIVYCLNPIVGIFLGLLNVRKTQKIILCGFLFEPKKNALYYKLRKKVTKKAIRGIDKIVVYGANEMVYYKCLFPDSNFIFVKYGIDFESTIGYKNSTIPNKFMFSGGGSNRDYLTLTEAYKEYLLNGGRDNLVIATQPWRLDNCDIKSITVLDDVVNETFGDLLNKSECLILSLKESELSAGHMVMFQAMSLNVPIIVNDIPAIRDYVDDSHVSFYPSKDVGALCKLMQQFKRDDENIASKSERAFDLYSNQLCFAQFLRRILLL